jgi:hypothetical protein
VCARGGSARAQPLTYGLLSHGGLVGVAWRLGVVRKRNERGAHAEHDRRSQFEVGVGMSRRRDATFRRVDAHKVVGLLLLVYVDHRARVDEALPHRDVVQPRQFPKHSMQKVHTLRRHDGSEQTSGVGVDDDVRTGWRLRDSGVER